MLNDLKNKELDNLNIQNLYSIGQRAPRNKKENFEFIKKC